MSTTTVSINKKAEPIALTEAAQAKVAALIANEIKEDGKEFFLRVAVKPGGCSGFSYDMFFDTDLAADDVVTAYGEVKVAVDAESASRLVGASLDYADGLTDAGFSITNPNASSGCGCGKSFS
ncbi:MAG: iron-sulfur cluster assembly accessory protein [Actinobacteria bacterium]|jgi:iron-sulfur cluster assembly protein/iron-sulfur cluster insertion protein|nr:iron-sulfur cluster assembly accessory protein [Actinomycetota bacterium]